jgi:putative restriction endonuclease
MDQDPSKLIEANTGENTGEESSVVDQELKHRRGKWKSLLSRGGPYGMLPIDLRELRIYGGAQGIWVDKARTGSLTDSGTGVTVGLLHTGTAYADDLSDDGVLYHYPSTNRPAARDLAEVDATKAAGRLGLPVFVITYSSLNPGRRDVNLGWVENWDDVSELFLITFGDVQPPQPVIEPDKEPFELVEKGNKSSIKKVQTRPGQQRFKLRVLKRYGPQCAVCDINVPELLDAAHLRSKEKSGSDDPRNGLVLCAVHHRALDAGLFAIEPNSLEIWYRASGPDTNALRIEYTALEHLPKKPHPHALDWMWSRWQQSTG